MLFWSRYQQRWSVTHPAEVSHIKSLLIFAERVISRRTPSKECWRFNCTRQLQRFSLYRHLVIIFSGCINLSPLMPEQLPPWILQIWLETAVEAAYLRTATTQIWENKWAQEEEGVSPLSVSGMFWLNWKPSFKLKWQHLRRQWGDRWQYPGLVCIPEHKRSSYSSIWAWVNAEFTPLLHYVRVQVWRPAARILRSEQGLWEHYPILSELRRNSKQKRGEGEGLNKRGFIKSQNKRLKLVLLNCQLWRAHYGLNLDYYYKSIKRGHWGVQSW